MSTQGVRGPPIRGLRRRKMMIDLNVPPSETRDQEGTSNAGSSAQELAADHRGQSVPPPMIDVEALDDDVVESSARAFAEAKSKSRTSRGGPVMVDVDSGCTTRLPNIIPSKRRRIPPNQPVIDCDRYCVNPEIAMKSRGTAKNAPPPEEPTFSCPICMGPFTQETSTKCGHIFCKECIKTAISRQSKCPTCRKKVTVKDLIRVFLPATR